MIKFTHTEDKEVNYSMKTRTFITIPIRNEYYGRAPFRPGRILTLTKDPDNIRDNEAIKVSISGIDTVGYVANSIYTVYQGTISAGRLYDRFDDYIYAAVAFVTKASVIAAIVDKEEVENNPNAANSSFLPDNLIIFCTE